MNKPLALLLTVGILGAGTAFAQTAATNASATPPAVATDHTDSKTSAAPVAGKNSFTKKETRDRLRKHGYSQIKGLTLTPDGIWQGTAVKEGKSVSVAVDYQGNIVEQ
jgi:hypothetical protein